MQIIQLLAIFELNKYKLKYNISKVTTFYSKYFSCSFLTGAEEGHNYSIFANLEKSLRQAQLEFSS